MRMFPPLAGWSTPRQYWETTSPRAAPGAGGSKSLSSLLSHSTNPHHSRVFHAEQMFSRTQTYHKKCFSCKTCKVTSDLERLAPTILDLTSSDPWTVCWPVTARTRIFTAGAATGRSLEPRVTASLEEVVSCRLETCKSNINVGS